MIRRGSAVTSFGRIVVEASERGVVSVAFGDEDARDEVPWLAAVVDVVEGRGGAVPLDLGDATPFRRRVWRALGEIPAGETRSYAEIARALGSPGAARAVGAACARNRIAVVIPCHRAVGSDGRLRGFRWGLEIKARLLDAERLRASRSPRR